MVAGLCLGHLDVIFQFGGLDHQVVKPVRDVRCNATVPSPLGRFGLLRGLLQSLPLGTHFIFDRLGLLDLFIFLVVQLLHFHLLLLIRAGLVELRFCQAYSLHLGWETFFDPYLNALNITVGILQVLAKGL